MTTEMITVKMDDSFLKDIDDIVATQGYQNRTEFIGSALREKVEEEKMKEAMLKLAHMKGSSNKKTTDDDLENLREKVFKELDKRVN